MEVQTLLSGKYRVTKLIGRGTFGDVFQGLNEETLEEVAVKTEEVGHARPQIVTEGLILQDLQKAEGVPKFLWAGQTETHNVLVMELLGPSLEDLLTLCGRTLSLSSVVKLAEQLLRRCEYIHSRGYIHRDLKPENLLMGHSPHDSQLYVIDFGLAKRFKDEDTHQHIPLREGKGLMGTARFASVNSHLGLELSRRDDLESLVYVLVYLSTGRLPWQGVRKESQSEKHSLILQMKQTTSAAVLCKCLPLEFGQFLSYVRALRFDEKPDYVYLRRLVKAVSLKRSIALEGQFEWTSKLKNPLRSYSASQLPKQRRSQTRLRTAADAIARSKTTKPLVNYETTESDTKCSKDYLPAFSQKTREVISRCKDAKKQDKMCELW